jgi:hypothetical protein
MSDQQDRFRCDYCGQLADLDDGVIFWAEIDTLPDGTTLYIPAVYCGAYCGRTATTRSGTGRG